jgi:hypothetical protein
MDEIKRRMYQPKTPPKEVWKIPSHFVEKWLGIFCALDGGQGGQVRWLVC